MSIDDSPSQGSAGGVAPYEETPLLRDNDDNQSKAGSQDERPTEETIIPEEVSNTRLAITLGSIFIGVFLAALDSTVIATLSAPISTSFNSLSFLSWLASAYLIANAACQPLSGRLTDIFSRRTGLVVSNVLFAAGNLICGLAGDEATMIAGRVVAGMGGGGLMAISTFVGSDLVPLRKRGLLQGIGNVCYGTGAGLGGIFGGWVNDTWGWRVAFLAQVPLVVISGVLVYFTVNIPPKKSEKSKLSRVDFLGAFTLVVTLVLLLLGLNSGGNIVPWTHPLVLISLPLSLVSLLLFIYIEAKVASEPVIPVTLLLNRTVMAACLCNWLFTMIVYAVLFYVPIFFQIKGDSTTVAGMRLIPQSIGVSFGSLFAGFIMNRTGKYGLLSLGLMFSLVVGSGLLSTLTFNNPSWPVYIYLFLLGSGYGGMLTVTLLACISAVSHDHQAVVTSATYAFRSTGSTIGITIASAVFQNLLLSGLHDRFDGLPGAEKEIRKIKDSFDELKHLPSGWKDGVMDSYAGSLRGVFLTSLGIAVLGMLHRNRNRSAADATTAEDAPQRTDADLRLVEAHKPLDITNARIITDGYDADVAHWLKPAGQNTVREHAQNLINDLCVMRARTKATKRPVLFVAHSLGGLVYQGALLLCVNPNGEAQGTLLDCTRGIAFMGAPNAGSDFEMFTTAVANIISLSFVNSPNRQLLEVLKGRSQVLANIKNGFLTLVRIESRKAIRRSRYILFFEELPIAATSHRVVTPDSAITLGYNSTTIPTNHMNMTKISTQNDVGYERVSGRLMDWISEIENASGVPTTIIRRNTANDPSFQEVMNDLKLSNASYYRYHKRADKFIPRPDLQPKIVNIMTQESGTATRVCILCGMGGQGKTALAIDSCRQAELNHLFLAIFWLDASSTEALKKGLIAISDMVKHSMDQTDRSDEERIEFTLQIIGSWNRSWLLIFDNYDNPDQFQSLSRYMPSSSQGSILVTSRNSDLARLGTVVEVPPMSQTEALSLLYDRVGGAEKFPEQREDAKKIVHLLGYLPLAINQAGAYIQRRVNFPLSRFIDEYEDRKHLI
ncbi:hypothetical protein G7Y89_g7685 [Cudoniella acicularis]|uniref:Major facilitator superfamily (MFS) profile domain-containing protein n=1 Tax=Cudoniella acicularis TaxID=354080 RepID=A0A8H4RI21_9HELO|nr:hypothetical protein G7Y89_g7685 [Cudoniella acicularis]